MSQLKQILLVEDNPDDELLTLRALKKSGFHVNTVVMRDGKQAIDYLLCQGEFPEQPIKPDLVFLDLKLPLLSGLEVLEQARNNSQCRVIPIVVLTSSKEEDDILKSYDLGANSYVRKRIDAREFETALKDILLYWFEFAKLPPR